MIRAREVKRDSLALLVLREIGVNKAIGALRVPKVIEALLARKAISDRLELQASHLSRKLEIR